MTSRLFFFTFLFVACISSCDDSPPVDWSDYRLRCIVNTWMDDYMDGCGGSDTRHFKPLSEENMLMWRFRNRMEILADGTATYTLASPEDPQWTGAVQSVKGTWTFNPDTMTLLILDVNGQILYSFLVHSVGGDFLHLSYNEIPDTNLPK